MRLHRAMADTSAAALLAALLCCAAGCGKKSGNVLLQSQSFPREGAPLLALSAEPAAMRAAALAVPNTVVREWKVCVRQVKVYSEGGELEAKDGRSPIEFPAGLVDLTLGETRTWGTLNIPVGIKLARLTVLAQLDPELCGVDYSVQFNDRPTAEDVEFSWDFDPVVELKAGATLSVAAAPFAQALREAGDAGNLDKIPAVIGAVSAAGSAR